MQKNHKILLALLFIVSVPVIYYFPSRQPYRMPESRPEKVSELIAELKNQPPPLTIPQAVELVSTLYNELGPRIGSHLVEPNTLITLAALRGYGNFLMHDLTEAEKERFKDVNNQLKNMGIEFTVHNDIKDEIAEIGITNLKGVEYISRLSKFPFVKPFDASTGFSGYKEWVYSIEKGAKKYFKDWQTKTTKLGNVLDHLLVGFDLGYPDQALLDFYNTFTLEKRPLTYNKIPHSNYHDNPQPNFSYLPEHKNEKSIVNKIKSWGNFLEEFYNSSWHRELEKDPEFIAMRKSEEELHNEWFKRKLS